MRNTNLGTLYDQATIEELINDFDDLRDLILSDTYSDEELQYYRDLEKAISRRGISMITLRANEGL